MNVALTLTMVDMNEFSFEYYGLGIEGVFKLYNSNLVKVELTKPYPLETMFKDVENEFNFSQKYPTSEFIISQLKLLCAQLKNFQLYGPIYSHAYGHYKTKVEALFEAINSMDFSDVRGAKFRYEIDRQNQFFKEYEAEIKSEIAEINSENQEQFIIQPSILKQIINNV